MIAVSSVRPAFLPSFTYIRTPDARSIPDPFHGTKAANMISYMERTCKAELSPTAVQAFIKLHLLKAIPNKGTRC
jgi:hypothetical protein